MPKAVRLEDIARECGVTKGLVSRALAGKYNVGDDTRNKIMKKADVDSDEKYTGDTEVIKDGYFHEAEFRRAPYFDLSIDGITNLGSDYKDKQQ